MVMTETSPISAEEDAVRRVLMVHRPNADDLCEGRLENRADIAPHSRGLTVKLTTDGRAAVEQITSQWKSAQRSQGRP